MTAINAGFPANKINWVDRKQVTTQPAKACLFNLIIYTHDSRRASYFQDIVRLIATQFPCRILFIWSDPLSTESYLHIKQAVEENQTQTNLNSDQFLIEASHDLLTRIPFIIYPYLVADVPIYLLWGQDLATENAILPNLQKYATRLIFDSETCENLQRFSLNMLDRVETANVEIVDMNWIRICGWRDVLIQTFDTEERIHQLTSSKQITITYNNRPSDLSLHPTTQALYLQAWLATQLNWEYDKWEKEDRDTLLIYYKTQNNAIRIKLQGETKQDIQAQEILEFEAEDPAAFLYSITRKDSKQVIVHCNTIDRCELPFNLTLMNLWSGKHFVQEVFYKKTSSQYIKMLHKISQINEK